MNNSTSPTPSDQNSDGSPKQADFRELLLAFQDYKCASTAAATLIDRWGILRSVDSPEEADPGCDAIAHLVGTELMAKSDAFERILERYSRHAIPEFSAPPTIHSPAVSIPTAVPVLKVADDSPSGKAIAACDRMIDIFDLLQLIAIRYPVTQHPLGILTR